MQKNLGQAGSLGPPTGHTSGGHFTEVTQEPGQSPRAAVIYMAVFRCNMLSNIGLHRSKFFAEIGKPSSQKPQICTGGNRSVECTRWPRSYKAAFGRHRLASSAEPRIPPCRQRARARPIEPQPNMFCSGRSARPFSKLSAFVV